MAPAVKARDKKPAAASVAPAASPAKVPGPAAKKAAGTPAKKLSYREQREFDELPAAIEELEAEQRDLSGTIADPVFYTKGAEFIRASLARQEALGAELVARYARWDELDARATRSSPAPSSPSRSR